MSASLQKRRCDVAVHLALCADEDDAVAGRIAFVPLHFAVWDFDASALFDVGLVRYLRALAGDDGNPAITVLLEEVCFVCVGISATRYPWIVGLLEVLEPLADVGRPGFPLGVIAH